MTGFGEVEVEPGEPRFHERWEATAFLLNVFSIAFLRLYNADAYRHALERMQPAHYLDASYYERVLTGVASLLVENGMLSHPLLEERAGGRFPLSRPVADVEKSGVAPASADRFVVGDEVRVRDIHPAGHTRVPRYVRGKRGEVVHVAPPFPFPDASAHGLPGRSEPTYHVLFPAESLWTDAAGSGESIVVDLWESYLEPAS